MRVLFLSWLAFFAACTHTETTPAVAADDGLALSDGKSAFLWNVTKDGKTSQLFGTIHVGVDAKKELPKLVWSKLHAASCFVMETDPATVDPGEIVKMSRLPPGQSLKAEVTPAAWTAITTKLGAAMPAQILDGSKPWFATLLYLQAVAPRGDPMDGTLLAQARAQGAKIGFLENWREAIDAFASAVEKEDLEELATNESQVKEQTDALLAAYRSGDVARLRAVIKGAIAGQTKAEEKMARVLAGRNRLWLPRLEKMLAGGGCFVAVGAAHLVGDDDLLGMLRKRGYTVKLATAK